VTAAFSASAIIERVLLRITNPAQTAIATDDSTTKPTMAESSVGLSLMGNRSSARRAGAASSAAGRGIGWITAGLSWLTNVLRFFTSVFSKPAFMAIE
jgi:hypothetical protein